MVKKRNTSWRRPDDLDENAATRSAVASPRSPARRLGVPSFSRGERLANRYRIERLVGQGGMGEVYEARDEELSIPVALKVLRLDPGREREALWRLKREVVLGRSVTHPHVCRVYDVARHGEGAGAVWFMTMELLHGETLQERLLQCGRLAPEVALPLAGQMATGLSAAHRAGVVHRDFKSGNVMLVDDPGGERAVVTDFGVARAVRGSTDEETQPTSSPVLEGTPAYMAPEQVRGEEVGPPADIYALGVVLYEMVTGRLPFVGKTALEVAARRLVEEVPSPRSLVAELDERWESVILRCLSREPAGRFARVEEVAEALSGRAPIPVAGVLGAPLRVRHTLPAERDAFVGRKGELGDLERKLGNGSRLVTLLGTAGMGKTRLAVRYGWGSLGSWPGGVWFCDLTEARSPDGIVSAIAGSLGVPLGKGDPVEQLGHAIAGRGRCLIILDNFEQVVEHAGQTVVRWLERAEEARFAVTSRERLNLKEEDVQMVEPLSLDSGTELFVERARHHRPGLELKGPELESVREVVRLTEAMPLAIELAAARVRVMTPAQLIERMRDRFRLLGGIGGGRHATLEAAIDWSWELLRPWEKAGLAQCSVFEGGFTLEAAEGVLDLKLPADVPWVVDVVQSLVDKSLLRTWVPEGAAGAWLPEPRFGMYASLQEYARRKLEEKAAIPGGSGAQAVRAAEERHGVWYGSYGTEHAIDALDQRGGVERRRALGLELENLVGACRRAVARKDGETAAAAYRAAWAVLNLRGPYGAAVELGREVLAGPLEREEQAVALMTLGQAERRSGWMQEARAHLEAALAIYRETGNRRGEGNVLGNLGNLHLKQGRIEEARAHYEAALAIHRQVRHRRGEGFVLNSLGELHREQGRMEEARADFEAALAIQRELGDRRGEGLVLGNLGDLHCGQGRMEEARAHFEAVLAIQGEVGDRRIEGVVHNSLGELHREQGRIEEARAHYEVALAIHRDLGDRRAEGIILGNLGILQIKQCRLDEARDTLARGESLLREVGEQNQLSSLLCTRAELERLVGDNASARATLGEAEALAAEVGAGPDSELGGELAQLRQALAET